jgi:hypothetical protein
MKLGTEASKGFPSPCRVPVRCEAGEASLTGVLPGFYDVQFKVRGKVVGTQRLELKPDGVPVMVTLP